MAIRSPDRYFDRRTVKRNIKSGLVTDGDYQQYLATLPDTSDNIRPRDDGGDDDGYEGRGSGEARPSHPIVTITGYAPPASASDFDDDDEDDEDDDDDDDDDDIDGDADDEPAQQD